MYDRLVIMCLKFAAIFRTSSSSFEVLVWIGRGSVIPWPQISSTVSLVDFSVWDSCNWVNWGVNFVKDQIYSQPYVNSIPELK